MRIGKLVKADNNTYLIKLDKNVQVQLGDFLKIKDNIGIVQNIILEDPDMNLSGNKEEKQVFMPDYLDEITSYAEATIINEDIQYNEISDEAQLMSKEEILNFHNIQGKFKISYMYQLEDSLLLKVLKKLRQYEQNEIIDVIIDGVEWKLRMQ